jgi:hypothetical protein
VVVQLLELILTLKVEIQQLLELNLMPKVAAQRKLVIIFILMEVLKVRKK